MELHALNEGGYFLRFAVALALGVAIGLERELRQRMAGLHTTAMVSIGAATFAMIAPMLDIKGLDPTRIAAQVVSGIGFLAGGVILRQGANVRGLTTAATLWATSAVGVLAGFGFLTQAAGAAASIILANIVLYWVSQRVDRIKRNTADVITTYTMDVACKAASEPQVRSLIVENVSSTPFNLLSLETKAVVENGVTVRTQIARRGRDDRAVEQLAKNIKALDGVVSTHWQAAETFV
jgi:putative Mg2+ transporter-C (MgtC) family protein